jgi:hypothetical protein
MSASLPMSCSDYYCGVFFSSSCTCSSISLCLTHHSSSFCELLPIIFASHAGFPHAPEILLMTFVWHVAILPKLGIPPVTVVFLVILPHQCDPLRVTYVPHDVSLLMLFPLLRPSACHVETISIEKNETYGGATFPLLYSPPPFDLIFHHSQIPFPYFLFLELSPAHQIHHPSFDICMGLQSPCCNVLYSLPTYSTRRDNPL